MSPGHDSDCMVEDTRSVVIILLTIGAVLILVIILVIVLVVVMASRIARLKAAHRAAAEPLALSIGPTGSETSIGATAMDEIEKNTATRRNSGGTKATRSEKHNEMEERLYENIVTTTRRINPGWIKSTGSEILQAEVEERNVVTTVNLGGNKANGSEREDEMEKRLYENIVKATGSEVQDEVEERLYENTAYTRMNRGVTGSEAQAERLYENTGITATRRNRGATGSLAQAERLYANTATKRNLTHVLVSRNESLKHQDFELKENSAYASTNF